LEFPVNYAVSCIAPGRIREETLVQKTRRQILDILKREGSATLEELAGSIGLSPVTIRAHLSVLERDDLITFDEVRGKVGRPHFVYSLATGAEHHFPSSYHRLADRFLAGFKAVAGPQALQEVVEQVAESWASERAGRLLGKDLEGRVSEVAKIRTEDGAMAEWERTEDGYFIRQYHCPVHRVAESHPEVCDAELAYVRRMLGVPVEREGSLCDGEGQCGYRVTAQ
jgi:predicted ArsR family transcriptional regulator